MRKFFKRFIYIVLPALLLSLSLLFVSGGSPKNSAFLSAREFLVLWEDSPSEEEAFLRLSSLCPEMILTEHTDNLSLVYFDTPDSPETVAQRLSEAPFVRIAEPEQSTVLCASLEEMQYGDTQWALHNTGNFIYYVHDLPILRSSALDVDINLPEAYELLTPENHSRPVTVAIVDTGVDISHPALTNHIWTNSLEIPDNGIDDDDNGYIDDVNGWDFYNNDATVCHYSLTDTGETIASPTDNDNHGTHCAGIVAASEGVLGIAAGIDVRILPLKIHGGEKNSGSISNAVKAIKYAQSVGADICNMSWGTTVYSEILETVMRESGMLFVVAAGNSGGNNNSTPLYPASYSLDNMISVAYVTQFGTLATDSNYGVSTVDIAAPGEAIYSTTVGGGYHYLSGTSMAAPMVSGVAALLYSYGDFLYPQNIKEILLQTLKPMDSLTGYIRHPGIVDASKALASVDSLSTDATAPTISARTEYQETALLVRLNIEDLGGSGIRTLRYAAGNHDTSYFCNGTMGHSLDEPVLSLGKGGTYTFYLSDYAGNEQFLTHTVQDDVLSPSVSVFGRENADGTFTVTVTATDDSSGLKYLRYLEGDYQGHFFHAIATDLSPEQNTFIATEGEPYSIYASDYRGNSTLLVYEAKRTAGESLFLNTAERTLPVGESFRLLPLLLPLSATDHISFSVSDETILFAAADGTLTGLSPGTVTVTVTTSGGLTKSCILHVAAPPSVDLPEPIPESLPESLPDSSPAEEHSAPDNS